MPAQEIYDLTLVSPEILQGVPRSLFPNETIEVSARVVAAARSGLARLRITLVQEGVSWFDDHDPSGALEGDVESARPSRHRSKTATSSFDLRALT